MNEESQFGEPDVDNSGFVSELSNEPMTNDEQGSNDKFVALKQGKLRVGSQLGEAELEMAQEFLLQFEQLFAFDLNVIGERVYTSTRLIRVVRSPVTLPRIMFRMFK